MGTVKVLRITLLVPASAMYSNNNNQILPIPKILGLSVFRGNGKEVWDLFTQKIRIHPLKLKVLTVIYVLLSIAITYYYYLLLIMHF